MRNLTGSIIIQTNATATDPDATSDYYCYYNNSPMAFNILLVLLLIFFGLSFAAAARRFLSDSRRSGVADDHRRRPPQRPPPGRRVGFYSPAARTFGLDLAVVRMLPVLAYGSVFRRIGGVREGCVVCLSEFEAKEKVKMIPRCGHVFHPGCIDGWLVIHGSCPICRCSDVSVDLASMSMLMSASSCSGNDEEEKVVVGLGRSRSLGCRGEDGDEEEMRLPLRRSCSV